MTEDQLAAINSLAFNAGVLRARARNGAELWPVQYEKLLEDGLARVAKSIQQYQEAFK